MFVRGTSVPTKQGCLLSYRNTNCVWFRRDGANGSTWLHTFQHLVNNRLQWQGPESAGSHRLTLRQLFVKHLSPALLSSCSKSLMRSRPSSCDVRRAVTAEPQSHPAETLMSANCCTNTAPWNHGQLQTVKQTTQRRRSEPRGARPEGSPINSKLCKWLTHKECEEGGWFHAGVTLMHVRAAEGMQWGVIREAHSTADDASSVSRLTSKENPPFLLLYSSSSMKLYLNYILDTWSWQQMITTNQAQIYEYLLYLAFQGGFFLRLVSQPEVTD